MARQRKEKKEKSAKDIKYAHPDRSAPSEQALLNFAKQRDLFAEADRRQRQVDNNEPVLPPRAERILETILWTVSMAMLHFTFDVLVQRQYGIEVLWIQIVQRTLVAWLGRSTMTGLFSLNWPAVVFAFYLLICLPFTVFIGLFYVLHPHYSAPTFVPFVPRDWQEPLRQLIFFTMSISAGCYIIYITNEYGYLAVLKQAPPVGCLWLWAVIELDLLWAFTSLLIAVGYGWTHGYGFK
ncbi:hypothetical protein MRS44_008880 [Fusarium solani]|uniref:uncharacterized protein n=1 Tax=Fusarium solani TaxID=169388 RepID=UPI0032C3F5BD|nr:hypothetical protein MRS44_008880 [Fusarium solani]